MSDTCPAIQQEIGLCALWECDLVDNASLITRLLNASVAPIGMQICIPDKIEDNNDESAEAALSDQAQSRPYLSALCSEINYKSSTWSPRGPVRRLHWSGNIFANLGKSDFTLVTHTLSRCFKFENADKLICSIDLQLESLKPEHLALLRGLGFTTINLIANTTWFRGDRVSDYDSLFEAITAMGFKNIEFIVYCDELNERNSLARGIIEICRRLSPNRIEFRSKGPAATLLNHLPCSDTVFKFLVNSLLRSGYLPLPKLNNNVGFVKTGGLQGKFQSRWSDWKPKRTNAFLSLGCSGVSRVGNLFLVNTPILKTYTAEGQRGVFRTEVEMIPDAVRSSEWLAAHLLEQGHISEEQLDSIESGARPGIKKICDEWVTCGVLTRDTRGYTAHGDQIKQREMLARLVVLSAYPRFGEHSYMLFA